MSFILLSRRLRDKLIENESLFLAMEVTTKCGLDPGAVWGAWGLAYLQVGKFKEARQTFSKLLKVCVAESALKTIALPLFIPG